MIEYCSIKSGTCSILAYPNKLNFVLNFELVFFLEKKLRKCFLKAGIFIIAECRYYCESQAGTHTNVELNKRGGHKK